MEKMMFAAFTDHAEADQAIAELHTLGYSAKDISVITKENQKEEGKHLGESTASGAVSGATTGGVIGGVAGLLTGAGIFPALAGLLIGGPITAALGLTGIAAATLSGVVTGVVAGGLIGALTGIGLSKDDAHYYNDTVNNGGILIAIPLMDRDEANVKSVLTDFGAQQIREVEIPSHAESKQATGEDERHASFSMPRQSMVAHQKYDQAGSEHMMPQDVEAQDSDMLHY
jgi:uncharacterized membrane protein